MHAPRGHRIGLRTGVLTVVVLMTCGCSAGGGGAAPPGAGGASGLPFGEAGGAFAAGGVNGTSGAPDVAPVGTADPDPNLPFAGYDPTVSFDWPQATTSGGSCKAGHYHGSFVGIYSPGIAVAPVPIPVAGDIDLTLAKSQNGEFYDITDGKLSGVADLLFPFAADVHGTLNCTTLELEGGFLSNGTYIVGVFPYPFEGPLPSKYDKLTHAFTGGEWHVGEPKWTAPPDPPPLYGGNGTWTATWVGP